MTPVGVGAHHSGAHTDALVPHLELGILFLAKKQLPHQDGAAVAVCVGCANDGICDTRKRLPMAADLREQLELVRNELDLINKILLEESLMGFPDAERRAKLNKQREDLKVVERDLLEKLAQT